jgi:hypothetical protein
MLNMNRYLLQKVTVVPSKVSRSLSSRASSGLGSTQVGTAASYFRALNTLSTAQSQVPRRLAAVTSALRFKSTAQATAAYGQTVTSFPSIVIGPDRSILPQGSFAEAQAQVGFCLIRIV